MVSKAGGMFYALSHCVACANRNRSLPAPTFDNSYARLSNKFYTRQPPTPVDRPGSIRINRELAGYLGVDAQWLASDEGTATVAGNHVPEGAEPLAAVYAGHQFGSYNPQLGDGRAVLLGEVLAGDGRRFDIQLKGSGPTPYSRGGDGRSALGPVVREYIVSEAMAALQVPTTRALAAVTTGERVARETLLPGGVLARVASSHIRVGTVEYFAARGETDALHELANHVIVRHFPECADSDNPTLHMLQAIIGRQAELIARWQLLGFIHGVMNTDNMLLCGETVDYGPCAFMDTFNPAQVYSSIDHAGRYAYRNQPGMGHWNLSRLAQSLLPLLDDNQERAIEQAQAAINGFPALFLDAHSRGLAQKLGLAALADDDTALVEDLFATMASQHLDFTLTFAQLTDLAEDDTSNDRLSDDYPVPPALEPWLARWRARLQTDSLTPGDRVRRMRQANPVFIARNHQVEAAIVAAYQGDFAPFHALVDLLEAPLTYRAELASYAAPPQPEEIVQQTFCGT